MKKSKSAGIIDMMELTLNQRKFTTSEIGRGIGIESSKKTYDDPVYVYTVINVSPVESVGSDNGVDQNQPIEFAFLRDTLLELGIKPEIGDIIEYDSAFWEIDNTSEAQYVASKNPDSWFGGKDFGYSVSIVCAAHRTRQSQLQLMPVRTGISTKKSLPKNV